MASSSGKTETAKKAAGKPGKKSPEETVAGFNALRQDQRAIASKLYELDCDLNEHK